MSSGIPESIVRIAVAATLLIVASGTLAQSPNRTERAQIGTVINRSNTIKQLGLASEAVALSETQRTEVNKIVDTYLAEQSALREKYAVVPGKLSSPEATAARQAARTRMQASISRVLNSEQKKSLQTAQEANQRRGVARQNGVLLQSER